MAKYKVLTRSFIDNHIVEPGAEIEFNGKAGSNLELIEPEAKVEKPVKPTKAKAEDSKADDLV
jgi:hypothetical protein